jgi:hypothetical protein
VGIAPVRNRAAELLDDKPIRRLIERFDAGSAPNDQARKSVRPVDALEKLRS